MKIKNISNGYYSRPRGMIQICMGKSELIKKNTLVEKIEPGFFNINLHINF